MELNYIVLWASTLLVAFMAGLWVSKEAEKQHWRCSFMPWKCPYAGGLFIYAVGTTLLVLLFAAVCGKYGLGAL